MTKADDFLCRNAEDPTYPADGPCKKIADPKYTLDFTDVEPGAYIRFCSACGPEAHRINDALLGRCESEPGFAERLHTAIKKESPS